MTTLDTRPRAPVLRPLSLGSTGRWPGLKTAMARLPVSHPIVLVPPDRAPDTLARTAADGYRKLPLDLGQREKARQRSVGNAGKITISYQYIADRYTRTSGSAATAGRR